MKSISGIGLTEVQAVYAGPEGDLWELIMGEQIHLGGFTSSQDLAAKADVKAHPLLGEVLHKKDVRKYLPLSRADDEATWDDTKSVEEIAELKAAGGFVDLMQWRAHRSLPVGMADDGYVLEYRLSDAGKNVFSKNWDKKAKLPKYMFDEAKVGFKSRTMDEIRDTSQPSRPRNLPPMTCRARTNSTTGVSSRRCSPPNRSIFAASWP